MHCHFSFYDDLHAEQNLSAEYLTEQTDFANIRKAGFCYSKNKLKVEELALLVAHGSLLDILRDSLAKICVKLEVKKIHCTGGKYGYSDVRVR